jgi:hypothetical protein
MGGACSGYLEGERCIQFSLWGDLRKREHLGNPGEVGRILLRWIFRVWNVGHGLDLTGSRKRQVAEHLLMRG